MPCSKSLLLRTRLGGDSLEQTFGMKNKNKSAKVQKQVQIIQQQEAQRGKNKEALEKAKEKERIAEKKKAEQAKKELEAQLYGGVDIVQPKVPFGVGALRFALTLFGSHR